MEMLDEIEFARSKRTIATILGLFLLVQALTGVFQVGRVLSGAWMDAVMVELILLSLCVFTLYPFIAQRYIRFYPNGISYLRLFSRRFLEWGEIEAISNSSLNQRPVLRLAGDSKRVDIILGEFLNSDEVVKFIDQKLNDVNDPRKRSLQAGLLQHMLAEVHANAGARTKSDTR